MLAALPVLVGSLQLVQKKKCQVSRKVNPLGMGGHRMAMAAVATLAALGLVCIAIGVNTPLTQQYFTLLCHVLRK